MKSSRHKSLLLLSLLASLLLAASSAWAGQASFTYDELGRLSQVIDEQGNVATYTYDAVGNLLSITRRSAGTPAPTVAGITPNSAGPGDTVNVTLSGQNLQGATLATDNSGITVSNVASTPTTITATFALSSTARSGPTTVIATTSVGTASTTFLVRPTLTSLSPNTGPPTRIVQITGAGPAFSTTPSLNQVSFNGTPATVFAATPTVITTAVPLGATTGPVTVTVGGLTSNGLVFTVTPAAAPPTIASISPLLGSLRGGTPVTIAGSGFTPDTRVLIGGAQTATTIIQDANTIRATTPPGSTGSADVLVTSANGDALLPKGFTYIGLSVTGVNPVLGAQGIGVNAPIQVQFSEPVAPNSVNALSVLLSVGGATVPTQLTLLQSNTIVQMTPANSARLQPNTFYAVTVSRAVTNPFGDQLVAQFTSGFTTGSGADTTRPKVTARSPDVFDVFAEAVARNARVMLRFDESINPLTLNNNSFQISGPFGRVPATINVGPDQLTATLIPSEPLLPNSGYTLNFSTIDFILDFAGNALQNPLPGTFGFSTRAVASDTTPPQILTVSPATGASSVPTNAPVLIQFSEPIAAPTVTSQSVVVKSGRTTISGTITFEQRSRVIRWRGGLPANATITLTVTPDVMDVAGNPMEAPFTSTFTTGAFGDGTRPTIVAISPADGATNVSRTTPIVMSFSKPMDPITFSVDPQLGTFSVFGGGLSNIPGSFSFSADRTTATFTPSQPLFADQTYMIQVSDNFTCCTLTQLEDIAGNKAVFTQSSFTTAVAPGTDVTALPRTATVVANPSELFADGQTTTTVTISNITQFGLGFQGAIGVPDGTLIAVSTDPTVGLFGSAGGTILGGTPSADPRFKLFPTVEGSVTLTYQSPRVALSSETSATIQVFSVDAAGVPVEVLGRDTVVLVSSRTARISPNPINMLANGSSFSDVTVKVTSLNLTPEPPGYQIGVTAAPVFPGDAGPPFFTNITSAGGTINRGTVAPDARFKLFTTGPGGVVNFTYTAPGFPPGQTGTAVIQVVEVDSAGNFLKLLGRANISLNGSTGFTSPQPVVVAISPVDGQTGVGTNAVVTAKFSQPLDPTTVTAATFNVSNLAGTRTLSASEQGPNTVVTFTPATPFAANAGFFVSITTGITSTTGNPLLTTSFASFTTGGAADTTAPFVAQINPVDGSSGVPLNTPISVEFSEPVSAVTVTGATVTVSTGGVGVSGQVTLGSGARGPNTIATFTPAQPLRAATVYTVTVLPGITDVAGNALAASVTTSFTTGTVADTTHPILVNTSPPAASTQGGTIQTGVPLNTTVSMRFNKPMNPSTINSSSFFVTNAFLGGIVAGTIQIAADQMSATFIPSQPLSPNTVYNVIVGANNNGPPSNQIRDVAGNTLIVTGNTATGVFDWEFRTGTQGSDTTSPTVLSITPSNGTQNVLVNSSVLIQFSEPVSPTSVTPQSLTLSAGGIASHTVATFEQNSTAVRLRPVNLELLQGNTLYTVTVTTGVTDLAGNPLAAAVTNTFTTGNVGDVFPPPTITSTNPANGATGVPRNTSINVTFSKAIDPTTVVVGSSFNLFGGGANGPIPGTLTFSPDNRTVTFVPSFPLLANQIYQLNLINIRSPAGIFVAQSNTFFTTAVAAGTDVNALPTAAAVTADPNQLFADGQTNATVIVSLINTNGVLVPDGTLVGVTASPAFQLDAAGGTIVGGTPSPADPRFTLFATVGGSVTLTYRSPALTLPPGQTASGFIGVTSVDAAGAPVALIGAATVTLVKSSTALITANPTSLLANGSSVSAISIIVFDPIFTLDGTSTVPPGTAIGVRIDAGGGTLNGGATGADPSVKLFTTVAGGLVELTYTAPALASGQTSTAEIEVVSVDGAGNVLGSLGITTISLSGNTGFTAPQPLVLAVSPGDGQSGVGTNAVVVAQFSQSLAPATVNAGTFNVSGLAGTYTLSDSAAGPNTVVTFTPATPFAPNGSFTVSITTGIQSAAGNPLLATSFTSFSTGTGADTTAPGVVQVNPVNGLTGVPINSLVTVQFSKPINPVTVNGTTFTVSSSAGIVSGRLSFANGAFGVNTLATFTPNQFLSGGTLYTVAVSTGIRDTAGNGLAGAFTSSFTTIAGDVGTDNTPPRVVSVTPSDGQSDVPVDAAIIVRLSEAINPLTLNDSSFGVAGPNGQVVGNTVVAADATSFTFTPTQPLVPSSRYFVIVTNSLGDVAGNRLSPSSFQTSFFTASSGTEIEPNDTPATATPFPFVGFGSTASFSATINPAGDVDYYQVVVNAGSLNTVTVTNTAAPSGPAMAIRLTVLDQDGVTVVASVQSLLNPGAFLQVPVVTIGAQETYFLRVEETTGQGGPNFKYTISFASGGGGI